MKVVHASQSTTQPADPDRFTGPVWRTDMVERSVPDGLTGQRFAYGPGARSHWHVHTDEQALIVLEGRGLVEWDGSDGAQAVEAGDWVHVEPGVRHWHGADDDSVFVHAAVTAGGETLWYDAAPPSGGAS